MQDIISPSENRFYHKTSISAIMHKDQTFFFSCACVAREKQTLCLNYIVVVQTIVVSKVMKLNEWMNEWMNVRVMHCERVLFSNGSAIRKFTTNSKKNIQFRVFALCKLYNVAHLLKWFPKYQRIRKQTQLPVGQ